MSDFEREVDAFKAKLEAQLLRVLTDSKPVLYTDDGFELIHDGIKKVWADLTPEQRAWLESRCDKLTDADLDGIAAAALRGYD